MKNKTKILAIDMDGTICENSVYGDSLRSKIEAVFFQMSTLKLKPLTKPAINTLYRFYYIKIFTARSWLLYFLTRKYLKQHGIKYDRLICGKTRYHLLIDDKTTKFTGWENIHYMMSDL